MKTSHQSGKAMLSVERDGDDLYASAFALTGLHTEAAHCWFGDAVSDLAVFHDWIPAQCFRMKEGDKMIFKVNFEQTYYQGDGYTSDDDELLVFTKAVKLYHKRGAKASRKSLKKYYRSAQ